MQEKALVLGVTPLPHAVAFGLFSYPQGLGLPNTVINGTVPEVKAVQERLLSSPAPPHLGLWCAKYYFLML